MIACIFSILFRLHRPFRPKVHLYAKLDEHDSFQSYSGSTGHSDRDPDSIAPGATSGNALREASICMAFPLISTSAVRGTITPHPPIEPCAGLRSDVPELRPAHNLLKHIFCSIATRPSTPGPPLGNNGEPRSPHIFSAFRFRGHASGRHGSHGLSRRGPL
jgi:hypothetical protein